jgi:hypothetical protein
MDEQTRDTILEAASVMRATISAHLAAGDREAADWIASVAWAVNREAYEHYPYWSALTPGPASMRAGA